MFDSLMLNNFNNNFFGMNSFNFNSPFAGNFSNSFKFAAMNYASLFNNFNGNFNSSMPMFPMGNSNFNMPMLPTNNFNFFNTGSFNMPMFNMPNMFNMFNNKFRTNSYNKDFDTKTDLAALKDVYKPEISGKLASIASQTASNMGSVGWCYRGVKDTFLSAGLTKNRLAGDSAFEARDILRNHKNFKEISVDKKDLTKLPAGCVIVWQPYADSKGKWHKDGHIAVTLGKGKEASDHEQNLVIGKSYSVFVPTGLSKTA